MGPLFPDELLESYSMTSTASIEPSCSTCWLEIPEASFTFEVLVNEVEESFADLNCDLLVCSCSFVSEADNDLLRFGKFTFSMHQHNYYK
jgi:hypothetical protein